MEKATFTEEQMKVLTVALLGQFMAGVGMESLTFVQDAKLVVKMSETFGDLTEDQMCEQLANTMEALMKEIDI